MRHYKGIIVKVGIIEFKVEKWDEHNHGSVYFNDSLIFDGYSLEASGAFKKKVDQLCENAEKFGYKPEIVNI